MKWVLIIWLGSTNNYAVYETFKTVEECAAKQETIYKALKQAESKMQLTCREYRPSDKKNQSNIVVNRHVFY
jgi:predicted aconitase